MTEVESLELQPLLQHKARARSGTLDVEAPDTSWEGRPGSQRFFDLADRRWNHCRVLKPQPVRHDQIIRRFIARRRRNFWIFIGLLAILVLVILRTTLSARTTRSWTMADYPRLPDPSSNIRLLQIKKGFRNRISYTMKSVPLAASPKYDALSYNWGDVRKKETISVNGIKKSSPSRTCWLSSATPFVPFHMTRSTHCLVWLMNARMLVV